MKNIFVLLLIASLYSQSINAQINLNKITDIEYKQIQINNISIITILNTHGNYSQLKSLFGNDLLYEEYDLPSLGKALWNNFISMRFEDEDYTLCHLEVFESTTVTIKGNEVKIGDNINKLGRVLINTNEGDYSVIFIDESTFTASLAFKIDPVTHTIVEISYNLF